MGKAHHEQVEVSSTEPIAGEVSDNEVSLDLVNEAEHEASIRDALLLDD